VSDEKTTLVAVDRGRLALEWSEIQKTIAEVGERECTTPEGRAWWARWLTMAQTRLVALEAEREVLVRPLIDDKRLVDGYFKTATAPLLELKALAAGKIGKYDEGVLAAQEALRLEAQAAAATGDAEACQAALVQLSDAPAGGGASTTFVWDFEVTDLDALPRWAVKADEAAIKAHTKRCAAEGIKPELPGVEFMRVARTAARGGKRS
jgi:hypothetical protein